MTDTQEAIKLISDMENVTHYLEKVVKAETDMDEKSASTIRRVIVVSLEQYAYALKSMEAKE